MLPVRNPFPPSFFSKLVEVETHHWWFRSRNKLLLWALGRKVKNFSNFLEIGCGTGYVLDGVRKVFPRVSLVGAEYFKEGLAFAKKRVPTSCFRQLDATKFEEVDSYDVIGIFDVLEHIEEDEKVLSNLARALRHGGSLMITVPQHRWLWSQADQHACHLRRYSRAELVKKVSCAGLDVDYVTSFVCFLVPVMWLSRRSKCSGEYDPMSELEVQPWLNKSLEVIMYLEYILIKLGVRLPLGGSLLLIARKI